LVSPSLIRTAELLESKLNDVENIGAEAVFNVASQDRDVEAEVKLSSLSNSADKTNAHVDGTVLYQYQTKIGIMTDPLRNVKVCLYDADLLFDDPIATTYTDHKGYYSFEFENGHGVFELEDDIYIRIFTVGETYCIADLKNTLLNWLTHPNGVNVFLDIQSSHPPGLKALVNLLIGVWPGVQIDSNFKPGQNFSDAPLELELAYYVEKEIYKNIDTGSTTTIDALIPYAPDETTYRAFVISQSIAAAQNFARDVGDIDIFGKVYICYPLNNEEANKLVLEIEELIGIDIPTDGVAKPNEEDKSDIINETIEDELEPNEEDKSDISNEPKKDVDINSLLRLPLDEIIEMITAFCYDRIMILKDEHWEKLEVPMHEYAHFIQWRTGTYGSYTKNMIYKHFSGHDGESDDIQQKGKEFGAELAWSEGWAEAFPIMVMSYYDYLHDIPRINECLFYEKDGNISFSGDGYVVDKEGNLVKADAFSGEGQEKIITAFLIDLYLPYYNKPVDTLSLGYQEFFRTSAKSGITSFSLFAHNLEIEYPQYRDIIGARLGHYQIAPKEIFILENCVPSIANPPTISWIGNGSIGNPYNQFIIAVSDDFNIIKWTSSPKGRSEVIWVGDDHLSPLKYTFTSKEWDGIVTAFSVDNPKIRIQIYAYHTLKSEERYTILPLLSNNYIAIKDEDDYVTGPYMSCYYDIQNPLYTMAIESVANHGNMNDLNDAYTYKFTARLAGEYQFFAHADISMVGSLYENLFGVAVARNSNVAASNVQFCITRELRKNETVYIQITKVHNYTGTFAFYIKAKYLLTDGGYLLSSMAEAKGDVVLPMTYKGESLIGIDAFAFKGNKEIVSVIFPSNILEIGANAFDSCINIKSIQLSESLQIIGAGAFLGCTKLAQITLPRSLQAIGGSAFENCTQLKTVQVLSITPPYMGEKIFKGCRTLTKILIPYLATTAYQTATCWSTYSIMFDYKKVNISIYDSSANFATTYYSELNIPALAKSGYDFVGLSYNDKLYTQHSVFDIYADNVVMRAKWNLINYSVVYFNADAVDDDRYNVNTANKILPTPERFGYAFIGWYDNPAFIGDTVHSIQTGSIGDKTFYAKWSAKEFLLNYNLGVGEILEEMSAVVKYEVPFELGVPIKNGYIFMGWYDVAGMRYANSFGKSVHSVFEYLNSDLDLYSKWRAESYVIEFDLDGSISWINSQGFNDETKSVLYDGRILSSDQLISLFRDSEESFREGYKFITIVDADGNPISWASDVPSLANDGDAYVIKPQWDIEIHTLNFLDEYTNYANISNIEFNTAFTLPSLTRTGYTFQGWEVMTSINGYKPGNIFNIAIMPDLTPNTEGDGALVLRARWKANEYTMTFNADGVSHTNVTKVTFGTAITIDISSKTGYTFGGWYLNNTQYFDAQGSATKAWDIDKNVTLIALWSARTYKVQFDKQGGINGTSQISVKFSESNVSASAPTRDGYDFGGYYTVVNGDGIQYFSSLMTLQISKWNLSEASNLYNSVNNSFVLYAYWIKNAYTITFNTNGGTAVSSKTYSVTDNFALSGAEFATSKYMYQFGGWYADSSLTTAIAQISIGTVGNKIFYAKWKGTVITPSKSQYSISCSNEVSILDLANITANSATSYKITIYATVKEITIVGRGTSNIYGNIVIDSRLTTLILRLKNLRLTAPIGMDAISSSGPYNLSIRLDGTNTIIGGAGVAATGAGVKGGDGKAAINASSESIEVIGEANKGGYVELTGGRGGDGGNGVNGGNGTGGAKGKDATENANNMDGKNGTNGGNGTVGKTGGAGGIAVIARSFKKSSGTAKLTGGNGGNGGKGGSGGDGGNGGNGGSDNSIFINTYPGNGGAGGNGGNGAAGGAGGAGGAALIEDGYKVTIKSGVSISSGIKGSTGQAGAGGNGGAGGRGGNAGYYGNNGRDGARGSNGKAGVNP
jgi:uncharacterized repeat protein (TIGR02543 family)